MEAENRLCRHCLCGDIRLRLSGRQQLGSASRTANVKA
jgi:hypothetical protein